MDLNRFRNFLIFPSVLGDLDGDFGGREFPGSLVDNEVDALASPAVPLDPDGDNFLLMLLDTFIIVLLFCLPDDILKKLSNYVDDQERKEERRGSENVMATGICPVLLTVSNFVALV